MSTFVWNDSFSVKVAEMDKQHQNLFDLLNKLNEAMLQGNGKEVLPGILDSLVRYTKTHFAAEEVLLQKYSYPGLDVQKRLHADFVSQLTDLQKKFLAGDFSSTIRTSDFLKKWLLQHIQGTDQKYGDFMNQKGIH